jgi:hypothetical protein
MVKSGRYIADKPGSAGLAAHVIGLEPGKVYDEIQIVLETDFEHPATVTGDSEVSFRTTDAYFHGLEPQKIYTVRAVITEQGKNPYVVSGRVPAVLYNEETDRFTREDMRLVRRLQHRERTKSTGETELPTEDTSESYGTTAAEEGDADYNAVSPYTALPAAMVTQPSGTAIAPKYWITARNQGGVGTCAACAATAAMAMLQYKTAPSEAWERFFSIAYYFGAGSTTADSMLWTEMVSVGASYGAPRWELFSTTPALIYTATSRDAWIDAESDRALKANAKSRFAAANLITKANAVRQKWTYRSLNFYDAAAMEAALNANGCVLVGMVISDSFDNTGTDGIVAQPRRARSGNTGHTVLVVGKTFINNKAYWIALNSWSFWEWGENGYCYIPYDYGIGAPSPLPSARGAWIFDDTVYTVSNAVLPAKYPGSATSVSIANTGSKKVKIKAALDSDTAYAAVIARAYIEDDWQYEYFTGSWYVKATGAASLFSAGIEITFDNKAKYQICVLTMDSNYNMGAQSVTKDFIVSDTIIAPFAWTYPKVSGGDFNLTAAEWNALTAKINAIRTAYDYGAYAFTTAVAGNDFTAAMFNQVRLYLLYTGAAALAGSVSAGADVTAAYMNALVTMTNSLI